MNDKSILKVARTFMPEIIAPGTGLSPLTPKSIVPTNNVSTINDILNGKKYNGPTGGGDWSEMSPRTWGEDSDKSYREDGDAYKRDVRDMAIIQDMLSTGQMASEKWKVKVPGGSRLFGSFYSANKYMKKLRDKGVNMISINRIAQNNKAGIIAEAMAKTFMVESLDTIKGIKEIGSAFCVGPSLFLTCAHVISKYDKNSDKARADVEKLGVSGTIKTVLIQNGRKHNAQVFKINALLDVALLKADMNVEPFEFDDNFPVGLDIMAIGSPHGYENNVTFGTIGSLDRKIYYYTGAPNYMFVDLSAFPGNSGCPIVNINNGKIVGMLTAIVSDVGEYGLNAGLPANFLEQFVIS